MIEDINPGNNSSNPTGPMKVVDGFVYFSANDGVHGYELWRTDGTEAGTTMVKDINQGENSTSHGDQQLIGMESMLFSWWPFIFLGI